jgi:DNA-binding NtrC family response regulator
MLSDAKVLDSSHVNFVTQKSNDSNKETKQNFYTMNLKDAKKAFETDYINFQLKRFDNNISQTAKFIVMERPALHKKIRDLECQSS